MQDFSRPPQSSRNSSARRATKRQPNLLLFGLIFSFMFFICMGILGFAVYNAGYSSLADSSNQTATVVAQNNASCQALIEKAMQVSNSFCSQIGSNKACYGNNTLKADLAPGTSQKFVVQGDIVDVDKLRRISASPLKLDSKEWGVAVLKVIANLPRSLPGQTVTMMVFGNTTLDNNKNGNLESFFFSSELGHIVCDKVPDDGIMVTVPDGLGVKFMVNGAELTLTGDASIKAVKNGKMQVSLYEGSGRIVSDGHEQYFGAGQQVTVQLGGENGESSVGAPSTPTPLSPNDLETACALTGQFCKQDQIIPVTSANAQQSIQEALGITPTPVPTFTPTRVPTNTATAFVTPTLFILKIPTWTPAKTATKAKTAAASGSGATATSKTPSKTPTRTPVGGGGGASTPTRTRTPTRTFTPIGTATQTRTPTPTVTPGGPTFTPTQTPTTTPTPTPTPTQTPTSVVSTPIPVGTFTPTSTPTPTPTDTDVPTLVPTPTRTNTPTVACGSISNSTITVSGAASKQLLTTITNGSSSMIILTSVTIGNAERLRKVTTGGQDIWDGDDSTNPKIISSWNSGAPSDRQIAASVGTLPLVFTFQNPVDTVSTSFDFTFNNGCTFSASYIYP